jgi:hypothetical protein
MAQYQGERNSNGKPDGQGSYTWPDGDKYVGARPCYCFPVRSLSVKLFFQANPEVLMRLTVCLLSFTAPKVRLIRT